ncbi:hypothetical protein [Clostridium perfringens]|uniref:Uncharacterized protein n=1 Tax=Clostridium perfringens TaxID=1502 RepID=A0AAW4J634_CLOPF|nr:hypothetical protein [Clostridium perfringens]MBO3356158.1 hypothetical protein [Clostridium perfringens]MBO3359501.1 hypothetical protein [Clostridium perfringens]
MYRNDFEIISRATILKPNIKIFYNDEDDWILFNYNQTLKECENLEGKPILKIEDSYYIYKKIGDNWFRKRKNII